MALDFFAGCLGGSAGIMVGYPLDTIKVHMQTQDYRNPKYKGNWHCFKTILAKESVAGLYRGMTSPLAGVALVNAIVFGVYGETQRRSSDPTALSSHFIAGALAGIAQSPICSPIELAKTRMQLQASTAQVTGPVDCLKVTYKCEGLRGVFNGLGITVLREAPSFGVYFLTYEVLTRTTANNNPVSTPCMLMAGGLAGTASWIISYPLDVIKSRIQAEGRRYNGIRDCFKKSLKTEGYSCLYRGLSSTILRAFPTNAVTFTVVTWTFRMFSEETEGSTETNSKIVESVKEINPHEPLLEKWSSFLTGASVRMISHKLNYSTMSMNEMKIEYFSLNQINDKWSKDGFKCGRKEGEKGKMMKEENDYEECGENKLERTVVKQTVNAVSIALA